MATLAPQRPAVRPSVAYRRILVPVAGGGEAAVRTACSLAAEHGAVVTAIAVIEVPAALPLDADMSEQEDDAREKLALAEAIGDRHGVKVERLVVRARLAGEAIVAAAEEWDAELIVLRTPQLRKTAKYVLQHARCRVLLSIAR
jgi:nucleotide-binding universal stress UspA family protein